jgi:lipopolysaccharide biosynthesis glycosyltransferase
MQSEVIQVAFGVDASYVPHVGTTIASLVAASPKARLHFTMLHSGVAADDRRRVGKCAPRAGFDWIEIDDPALLSLETRGHISAATSYRLALTRIVPPEVRRVLYLDSDMIVVRDISELWRTDMRKHAAAAVSDPGVDAADFAARWGLPSERPLYFNAGVILLDLAAIRAHGIFDTALDFLAANLSVLTFRDQDALNYALWQGWLKLDPIWNVQRTMAIVGIDAGPDRANIHRRPGIIHFTTEHKPWLPDAYTPYAWLYWRSLMRTPFREQVEATYGVDRGAQLRMFARYAKRWPFLKA